LPGVKKEDGGGVAQVADGGHALHVAALDGLEFDDDAGQGRQTAGGAFAGEFDGRLPLARLPTQAARLTAGGRRGEESVLQLRPLLEKQVADVAPLPPCCQHPP